jgi:hypothetical protein
LVWFFVSGHFDLFLNCGLLISTFSLVLATFYFVQDTPCFSARVLILSDFLIVIIIFVVQGRLGFAARDTISLLNPPSKIDELAAIRAERSMGIIFPLRFTMTGWALDPK